MRTTLRYTLLAIAITFAVTTISGCAATHYGGGLDATYGGDGIRIGADGHFGVLINGGLSNMDTPLEPSGGTALFSLTTGLEYNLAETAIALRMPGPRIEFMGNPTAPTYQALVGFNTVQSFSDGRFSFDIHAGGGMSIPVWSGEYRQGVLIVGPVATLSIGFDDPTAFLVGIRVDHKNLNWQGLLMQHRRLQERERGRDFDVRMSASGYTGVDL